MMPEAREILTADRASAQQPKKRRRKNWTVRLGLLAMAATLAYSAFSFVSLTARLNSMRQDAAALQQSLYDQQRQGQALQKEIQALQTDSYIEKVAREQYHMTKPGEIRYLTGEAGNGSTTVKTAP